MDTDAHPGRANAEQQSTAWSGRVLTAVAFGAVLGATARWGVGTLWERTPDGWPWATLVVNLAGCIGIGFAARRLELGSVGWAFVVTGVLGGFTTFSAFAIEVTDMLDADRFGLAACYLLITLIGGHAATAIAERNRAMA
jgi:fluoride exporter